MRRIVNWVIGDKDASAAAESPKDAAAARPDVATGEQPDGEQFRRHVGTVRDELDQLINEARTAAPSDRVDLYRDRVAGYGRDAVDLMVGLSDDRVLSYFCVTVLRKLSQEGVVEATFALRALPKNSEIQGQQQPPPGGPTLDFLAKPPYRAIGFPARHTAGRARTT